MIFPGNYGYAEFGITNKAGAAQIIVAQLRYIGKSSVLDYELTGPTDPERRTMKEEACDFLTDLLSNRWMAAKDVEAAASKAGIHLAP